MASSGSFSGSICSGHYVLKVDWTQTQNVSANTSTVACTISLVNDWSLSVSGRTDNTCTIDGTSKIFSSAAVSSTGTHSFATVSQTVSHESDGSKSLTIIVGYNIRATISGTYYSTITATATITLDSIARASSVSASSVNMGSATTVTITTASSSFTHTLAYSFGSTSGTIATKTSSTSVSWTPPLTLANQIPSATSGTCTITCTTYNGSTSIGSKTCTLTLTVPSTVIPTISSLTATRVDGDVPEDWGIYVKTKSKATLAITGASGSYGSTIKSYSISGGGYSSTASSFTTGYLNTSGTVTFTAYVTDSRGRTSAAATVSISVVNYAAPSFSSYSSQRCTSDGTVSNDGTYIRGLCKYNYYSCSSNNTITRSIKYKKSSATSWTSVSSSFSYNTAVIFGSGNISGDSSYDVQYTLTDAFTSVSVVDTVSTAAVVMDFKSGGAGLAVGKVAETDDCFEVSEDWEFKVYGEFLSDLLGNQGNGVYYGTCATTASTVAKEVTCSSFTELTTGAMIAVKFTATNTASSPTLNVNSTGAKTIVGHSTSVVSSYYWKPGQTVIFVYDGTYWVAQNLVIATTTYYGLTKLSSSTSSTSTTVAATASAVKAAYDRSSWDTITLTNALGLAYGGTGATTAAVARTNLGIACTSLYSGTLTTGSTTFTYSGYKAYIIIGQTSTSSSRCAVIIPASQITTSEVSYQIADETNYYSFNLSYSSTTVTLAYKNRSSSGQILRVWGVN
ncbi:MAG: DUF859 domain-containing protein [Lachnospiraceae bacterium]|nr:DUF859 domain-containing protein [Lachnospiraceae bacterium]